jgi:hypothetical protein
MRLYFCQQYDTRFIFCQMSQKWRFDPKWRIKIIFFVITLRVSNMFSIFFLHSFGVCRRKDAKVVKKKFLKKFKMATGMKKFEIIRFDPEKAEICVIRDEAMRAFHTTVR